MFADPSGVVVAVHAPKSNTLIKCFAVPIRTTIPCYFTQFQFLPISIAFLTRCCNDSNFACARKSVDRSLRP